MILDAQRDNTQLCDMGRQALSHTHGCVNFMCSGIARHDERLKKCACDEVCCLHLPSRARHAVMSAREICEQIYENARILQSGCHVGFAKSL